MKEKETIATSNKSSWTILTSAFGTRDRFFIQSQLPLRLDYQFSRRTRECRQLILQKLFTKTKNKKKKKKKNEKQKKKTFKFSLLKMLRFSMENAFE